MSWAHMDWFLKKNIFNPFYPPPPPEIYGGAYKMCSEISKINIKYL